MAGRNAALTYQKIFVIDFTRNASPEWKAKEKACRFVQNVEAKCVIRRLLSGIHAKAAGCL